jgi:hypothetical protein
MNLKLFIFQFFFSSDAMWNAQLVILNGIPVPEALFPPTPVLGNKVCNTVVDQYVLIAELMQSRLTIGSQTLNQTGQIKQLLITNGTKMVFNYNKLDKNHSRNIRLNNSHFLKSKNNNFTSFYQKDFKQYSSGNMKINAKNQGCDPYSFDTDPDPEF